VTTYNACWPIYDDAATLRDLIAEAAPELHQLVAGIRHEMVSEPEWTTTDAGGLSLLASVEVEPALPATDRTAAIVEDVEFLLDADATMTAEAIGLRIGISADGVVAALKPKRADRPDLIEKLAENGREFGKRQHAEAMNRRRVA
jgi:hypothetical protein